MNNNVEQIIKYVDEYKAEQEHKRKIQSTINSYRTDLKRFMDTGNKHIHISFNREHNSYESIYRGDHYPSDKVKEVIQQDIEKYITELEKEKSKVDDRINVLSGLITIGVSEEQ